MGARFTPVPMHCAQHHRPLARQLGHLQGGKRHGAQGQWGHTWQQGAGLHPLQRRRPRRHRCQCPLTTAA